MRLWHKDLISVLPRQQLLGQWREVFAIYRDFEREKHGEMKTSAYAHKHPLVNYVNAYPINHLLSYGELIYIEMINRGYSPNPDLAKDIQSESKVEFHLLFENDHNHQYLEICYFNLKEKHIRGLITPDEWLPVQTKVKPILVQAE